MNNFNCIGNVGHIAESNEKHVKFTMYFDYYIKENKHSWTCICLIFKNDLERLQKRIEVGNVLYVQGLLFVENYETDEGIKGKAVKLFVNDIQVLFKKKKEEETANNVS